MLLVTASEENTTWAHPLQYFVGWKNRSIWNSLDCRKCINQPANQWSTIELLMWQRADGKTRKTISPHVVLIICDTFSPAPAALRVSVPLTLQCCGETTWRDGLISLHLPRSQPYMSEKPPFSALLCSKMHLLALIIQTQTCQRLEINAVIKFDGKPV